MVSLTRKRKKGEWLCGDEVITTYGSLKDAQNEAYRDGIKAVVRYLVSKDYVFTASNVEDEFEGARLFEVPRCFCEPIHRWSAND